MDTFWHVPDLDPCLCYSVTVCPALCAQRSVGFTAPASRARSTDLPEALKKSVARLSAGKAVTDSLSADKKPRSAATSGSYPPSLSRSVTSVSECAVQLLYRPMYDSLMC